MATRPKAVIESRNGEKFSPITIAKNVLTDDGQNLHDILSDRKEDMITPTIENSSSMFKVGQGDSVDFSDNVMDGAYEGVVLKGKSLVNVIQGSSKDKVTLDSENATAYPVVIKPNTKYSIVAHKDCNYHTTNLNYTFDLGGATTTCSVNDTITIVTTPSTLAHQELRIKGQGLVISSVRVIEGEVSQDLPYFEGICDVKSPIVKNVGKNLFDIDGEWVHSTYGYNTVNQSKENQVYTKIGANEFKIETGSRYENGFGQYINVQGLEEVRIKATFNDLDTKSPSRIMGARLNKDESLDKSITNANHEHYRRGNFVMQAKDGVVDMVVPTNGYSTLFVNFSGSWKNNEFGNHIFTVKDVYVGANEDYEPYKSNTTTFNQKDDKTIALRSLPNGACDTLNVETGELTQRIGEVVLDGSEDEGWKLISESQSINSHFKCRNVVPGALLVTSSNNSVKVLCDDYNSYTQPQLCNKPNDYYGISLSWSEPTLCVRDTKFAFTNEGIAEFTAYLQQNPITVQYELATPIVSTIDVQGFPYAYKDGHVQLSSSSIEQSLTPKVEYSVATNRSGQIRSNQKMVERHQKQLDRLQAMVLTNLVNTQYEQTLTSLKYGLKNVREEVK